MASTAANKTLVGLIKRGWNEIPEVVGSSVVGLVGIGLAGIGLVNYYRKDGDNRRYKHTYVVMRPDDPRVSKIRQD
ncbi:unnamed protein product [Diamesa hyperborea]